MASEGSPTPLPGAQGKVTCQCGAVRYYPLNFMPSLNTCPACKGLAFGLRKRVFHYEIIEKECKNGR